MDSPMSGTHVVWGAGPHGTVFSQGGTARRAPVRDGQDPWGVAAAAATHPESCPITL
jgi:hypothetical protein